MIASLKDLNDTYGRKFIEHIISDYNSLVTQDEKDALISVEALEHTWKEICDVDIDVYVSKVVRPPPIPKPVEQISTCKFQLNRGERKGMLCGKQARFGDFCGAHVKDENKNKGKEYQTCTYVLMRGDRSGQPCGARVKQQKEDNITFCPRHYKMKATPATE